ncbi:MAG TPA: hypothetical protein VH561_03290 [Micromonosporaceae bacterium]
MTEPGGVLQRLRDNDIRTVVAAPPGSVPAALLDQWARHGVRMAASGGPLVDVWNRAVAELISACIHGGGGGAPVLREGGVYRGTWLESTGTISAEVLGRFLPAVARDTFMLFAERIRDDGLLPYKVTDAGASYRQIQIVTPLARSVWNHAALTGDTALLGAMYVPMARNDAWLAAHRDTRRTGCVEAFCTFDTGHDASPRFWHVPDTTLHEDATAYDPDCPVLPYLAPDLTANVACQRRYLARIARALGEDATEWLARERHSTRALFDQCYDRADGMFYDRDRTGAFVRVQSDVLLRVLACEIGDAGLFEAAARRYLLNSRKFFARYPFTSLAMDDPRFDHDWARNSWAGPTNFLSLLRAPHAFEHHGHHVELSWALHSVLGAVARMTRFPQTLHPWTGEQGFTEQYSPAILWTLDAIERLAGILPRPEGEVWCTALTPAGMDYAIGYARIIDATEYEFVHDGSGAVLYRDGELHANFPHGWRLVTDRAGQVRAIVGMSARPIAGTLATQRFRVDLRVAGNERVELDASGEVVARTAVGVVRPST